MTVRVGPSKIGYGNKTSVPQSRKTPPDMRAQPLRKQKEVYEKLHYRSDFDWGLFLSFWNMETSSYCKWKGKSILHSLRHVSLLDNRWTTVKQLNNMSVTFKLCLFTPFFLEADAFKTRSRCVCLEAYAFILTNVVYTAISQVRVSMMLHINPVTVVSNTKSRPMCYNIVWCSVLLDIITWQSLKMILAYFVTLRMTWPQNL